MRRVSILCLLGQLFNTRETVVTFELRDSERFLIEVIREFDFLRALGYQGKEFVIYSPGQSVLFSNEPVDRELLVVSEGKYRVIFIKKYGNHSLYPPNPKKAFEISVTYDHLGCPELKVSHPGFEWLSANAKFIQEHLMPVITGEMWIDELLKKRG